MGSNEIIVHLEFLGQGKLSMSFFDNATIKKVKQRVEAMVRFGIQMRTLSGVPMVKPLQTLRDYNIFNNSTIFVFHISSGGGNKRKRNTEYRYVSLPR
jgi:hypothetical protein